VTLTVCPICRQETGDLLLDMQLEDRFDRHTMTLEPCQACREKYLTHGVLLIAHKTNRIVVITDDAFARMFDMDLPPKKIAFCEEGVMDLILTPPQEPEEAS
jgi:hypothetical protein